MNPYVAIAGFVIGVSFAIGTLIYEVVKYTRQENNYSYDNTDRSHGNESTSSNLTCCYCGGSISPRDHKLNCGHICHKKCYSRQRSRSNKCALCDNDDSSDVVHPVRESENPRRRATAASPPDATQPSPSTSHESVNIRRRATAASPPDATQPCSYCNIPITDLSKVNKTLCGHYVHPECAKSIGNFMKCVICVANDLPDPA